MCGINGFYFNYENEEELNKKIILEMNRKITHRGPDDEGSYSDNRCSIGMTRLSIIDLVSGKQPITNETNSLKIVFNGEIYNYKELRKELINKGHIFKTDSDTEVVLHLYEEYGNECVKLLKGMFAFAIYSLSSNTIFLARDRAGEKPLYYYKGENAFVFASELKSIIASNIIEKRINKIALEQYFMLTYIPAPLTILEDVYKLKAGHYMIFANDGSVTIEKYWDIDYSLSNKIESYSEAKNILRETLFSSVEKCMVSDVPIGSFLSGGIDSTIITGIMATISNKPINTFTIGFKDKRFDESDRAALVAKMHNTKHHVFVIDSDNMLNNISKIIDNIDEPFADSSYIPTFTVSDLASKNVKVVLTGDAGDELFAGYDKYLIGYYSNLYKKIPSFIRKNIIETGIKKMPQDNSTVRKINKVVENFNLDIFSQRENLMCLGLKKNQIGKLLSYESEKNLDLISEYYNTFSRENATEIDRTLYTDFKVVLEGDMLCKVDRASMLSSLETRVPFLYPDVIEVASQIPAEYKIKARNKKIILKDTFSDLIPKELLKASKKGFSVPLASWIKNELYEDIAKALDYNKIKKQELLNADFVQQLLNEHIIGAKNNASIIWAIYVFEKWYSNYFEN